MGYEINVSKNGKHYFATHDRSLPYTKEAEEAFKDFKTRFPLEEGFEVTITYYPKTAYGCHIDESGNLRNSYIYGGK